MTCVERSSGTVVLILIPIVSSSLTAQNTASLQPPPTPRTGVAGTIVEVGGVVVMTVGGPVVVDTESEPLEHAEAANAITSATDIPVRRRVYAPDAVPRALPDRCTPWKDADRQTSVIALAALR
jgi:hypothetical protein